MRPHEKLFLLLATFTFAAFLAFMHLHNSDSFSY